MRAEAPLQRKPASVIRELQIAAVALSRYSYLATYKVVSDEPRWSGVKKPEWIIGRRTHYEVRHYAHCADRTFTLLDVIEKRGGDGRALALEKHAEHRERLYAELEVRRKAEAAEAQRREAQRAELNALAGDSPELRAIVDARLPPQPPSPAPEPALGLTDAELEQLTSPTPARVAVAEHLAEGACPHGVPSWSYDKVADAYWCEACGGYLHPEQACGEFLRIAKRCEVAPRLPELGQHRDWCASKFGKAACDCPARAGEPLPAYYADKGTSHCEHDADIPCPSVGCPEGGSR